jgi:hypothetical protein
MKHKICCSKCKSENVVSIDNEPLLHHDRFSENDSVESYDSEIYMIFVCKDCKNKFTVVFNLTPAIYNPTNSESLSFEL